LGAVETGLCFAQDVWRPLRQYESVNDFSVLMTCPNETPARARQAIHVWMAIFAHNFVAG